MAALGDVIAALDELLAPHEFSDYGPNGLQVSGRDEVQTVATGVSAHAELFELALAQQADLVLTHHGILWDAAPRRVDAAMARRLRLLLDNEIGLAAYHLPLDAHPEVGNNALIAEGLGCARREPFADHHGRALGCVGHFDGDGIGIEELIERVRSLTDRQPLVFAEGPAQVGSLGIVSGAGAGHLDEAIDLKLDAFLTGEPAERVMAQAKESGLHFIAAGHYATETFGVRALGEHLADRFGVRHVFLDVPNPV